jgi:hypothetical protein
MLGYVDLITRCFIRGWAADPKDPAAELELRVRVNGKPHGRTRANQQRDSLCALFPGATGRYEFHYEFEWPLSPFETHEIEVGVIKTGERLPNGRHVIAQVGTSPVAVRSSSVASFVPILVTSTGRSGSSLCMARLATHPDIVVAGDHPHEILLVSYYALALRTLISEADRTRSMHPDHMIGRMHRFGVGFNPFNESIVGAGTTLQDYWNNRVPERLAAGFADLIRDYYGAIDSRASKPQARFFAEKANPGHLVRRASRMMFGSVREVALIRDPRDLVCSYRTYFKASPESAILSIRSQMDELRRERARSPADILFVRYEDLIVQPEATMNRIWGFLEVESLPPALAAQEQALFERHGTSASAVQSIGRWRNELSAPELDQCREKFREILDCFGYEST